MACVDLSESGARLVQYRKKVDDMFLVAIGRQVGPNLANLPCKCVSP